MLRYTEIPKSDCHKISVATVLLNSNNTEENYEGDRYNLALVYHRFIERYVLLIKSHVVFETDKFLILKNTKQESVTMLEDPSMVNYISKKFHLTGINTNSHLTSGKTNKRKMKNTRRINKRNKTKTAKKKRTSVK